MIMPADPFAYVKGAPKSFTRTDIEGPGTREFCAECGTHLVSRAPGLPGAVIVKVGTLDEPSAFGNPQIAIFTCDKQSFHQIPAGVHAFERVPG